MKFPLLFVAVGFSFFANAQNVGIGNPSPAEKLDITGNVNITGALKTNGNAGSNGQVLMSTGSGLSWGSMAGYKKCVMFTAFGSGNWVVPAGVTEVMAEVWGGGSGGSANFGGTSGGYARTVQQVTPGNTIAYTIGNGSFPNSPTTLAGGNSTITFPIGVLQALGGGGVLPAQAGAPASGTCATCDNAFFMAGNPGTATSSTFGQRTATIYVQTVHYGNGGAPVALINTTPLAGDVIILENGTVITSEYGIPGKLAGAGGPGGTSEGWQAAAGMVIFWFN